MRYKCEFCEKETRNSRNNFSDINWIAFQINNEKTLCACYEHHQELIDLIKKRFIKKESAQKVV